MLLLCYIALHVACKANWLLTSPAAPHAALEPTSEVSASDNYPCFDGVVTVTDVNVALTSKTAAQCNDKVLFNIKR